jgi:hypothetical protein
VALEHLVRLQTAIPAEWELDRWKLMPHQRRRQIARRRLTGLERNVVFLPARLAHDFIR